MSTETLSQHAATGWQDGLDPALVARLSRRGEDPGLISLAVVRRIVGWVEYFAGRLPLMDDVRRRQSGSRGAREDALPIVHARWGERGSDGAPGGAGPRGNVGAAGSAGPRGDVGPSGSAGVAAASKPGRAPEAPLLTVVAGKRISEDGAEEPSFGPSAEAPLLRVVAWKQGASAAPERQRRSPANAASRSTLGREAASPAAPATAPAQGRDAVADMAHPRRGAAGRAGVRPRAPVALDPSLPIDRGEEGSRDVAAPRAVEAPPFAGAGDSAPGTAPQRLVAVERRAQANAPSLRSAERSGALGALGPFTPADGVPTAPAEPTPALGPAVVVHPRSPRGRRPRDGERSPEPGSITVENGAARSQGTEAPARPRARVRELRRTPTITAMSAPAPAPAPVPAPTGHEPSGSATAIADAPRAPSRTSAPRPSAPLPAALPRVAPLSARGAAGNAAAALPHSPFRGARALASSAAPELPGAPLPAALPAAMPAADLPHPSMPLAAAAPLPAHAAVAAPGALPAATPIVPPAAPRPVVAAPKPELDVDDLVEKVQKKLLRRIAAERDRRGGLL